jgi:hypothetical protein
MSQPLAVESEKESSRGDIFRLVSFILHYAHAKRISVMKRSFFLLFGIKHAATVELANYCFVTVSCIFEFLSFEHKKIYISEKKKYS